MTPPNSRAKNGPFASLATKHAGVVAWSREANPAIDENGPPTMLFQAGEVLDME
jgi:hypothetical protein